MRDWQRNSWLGVQRVRIRPWGQVRSKTVDREHRGVHCSPPQSRRCSKALAVKPRRGVHKHSGPLRNHTRLSGGQAPITQEDELIPSMFLPCVAAAGTYEMTFIVRSGPKQPCVSRRARVSYFHLPSSAQQRSLTDCAPRRVASVQSSPVRQSVSPPASSAVVGSWWRLCVGPVWGAAQSQNATPRIPKRGQWLRYAVWEQ